MLIGQLSKLSGFPKDTIRYYEKIQLIDAPKPKHVKAYKDYPEDVLSSLKLIRKYKGLGFTLEEIRQLLVWRSMKVLDVAKLLQIMELKISGMDEQIEKLHAYKLNLVREMHALTEKKTAHIIALPEMKIAA